MILQNKYCKDEFKPKTNKKVKIPLKNMLFQMILQGGWIYKFIQFKFQNYNEDGIMRKKYKPRRCFV